MFNKKNTALALAMVVALGVGAPSVANAGFFGDRNHEEITQMDLDQAKISITQAIEKAKSEHKGTIVEIELEKEDGKLFYEIEYLSDNDQEEMELLVDAVTGEVHLEEEYCDKERRDRSTREN